jgi:hypothetical protein
MRTHITALTALSVGALALALTACEATDARSGRERVIVVPSTATTTPAYERDGSVPSKRYVVRMSDGKRDWEIEFPDTARGYRLNIPMGSKPSDAIDVQGDALTEADKRFIEANRRENVGMEREGMYVDGKNAADPERPGPGSELPPVPGEEPKKGTSGADGVDPWSRGEDTPAPSRRSYYLGIEKVQQLYRARRYEVAIVYLTKLDEDYPNDVKIMSMMGTLLMKTNKLDAAREYWERVLAIDPTNRGVIEAMKQLNARQGFDAQPPAGDPLEVNP